MRTIRLRTLPVISVVLALSAPAAAQTVPEQVLRELAALRAEVGQHRHASP